MTSPEITVFPRDGLADQVRQIGVAPVEPGTLLTLRTSTRRARNVLWESQATWYVPADGRVSLTRDAPIAGDYAEVDPMGLIWSQMADDGSQDIGVDDIMAPLETLIVASTAAGEVARTTLIQRFAGAGVQRTEIREEGLVGTLFTPANPGPHPVVIVLNGSTGGINEARGALLASHGYQAFALGYFKVPGRSPYITNTPLEYFATALTWVEKTLQPRHGFVAVSGQSRGGELALLLGTRFPQRISAVIAYVPGAMVHGAQGAADPNQGGWCGPTWTEDGKPLPHLWQNNAAVDWQPWDGAAPPNRHHNVFLAGLSDTATAARARIPVERIQSPVLLISGRDDRAWPSSLYSQMVSATLARHRHPHPVVHLDFDNAGHSINYPWVPTTTIVRQHPVSGVPFTSGGTPSGNARADEGSWQGLLHFLANAVQRHAERAQ